MVDSPDTLSPPQELYLRGEANGHTTLMLTVKVCQDPTGRVWSHHDFASAEDHALSGKMQGQGAAQVAHALLTEALRRETFVSALASLTADEKFLQTYKDADEEGRRKMEAALGTKVREVIWRTLGKMGQDAAREVLEMMTAQLK